MRNNWLLVAITEDDKSAFIMKISIKYQLKTKSEIKEKLKLKKLKERRKIK